MLSKPDLIIFCVLTGWLGMMFLGAGLFEMLSCT